MGAIFIQACVAGHVVPYSQYLLRLDVVSDSIVAAAYCSILLLSIYLSSKRRDLSLYSVYWILGIVIVSDGAAHALNVLTVWWYPAYWAAGVAKAMTATASVACVAALIRLVSGARTVPTQSLLEEANRALKESQIELARARDEALERARRKAAFIANMSHELRTPLNGIIGFVQLLYSGHIDPASGEYKQSLGNILSSARHLLSLTNDALDLSKVRSGNMEFAPEPVEAAQLVEEVSGVLRAVAAQKDIEIEAEVAPELGQIVVDCGKLRQVLYNYVSNAIKFGGKGTRVTIRMRPDGDDWFRLEVEDNGKGICAEDLTKLFIDFRQLDSASSEPYQGTGLGLALTRRIVEAQGGRVGATSELGKGSIFWAVLARRYPMRNSNGTMLPE